MTTGRAVPPDAIGLARLMAGTDAPATVITVVASRIDRLLDRVAAMLVDPAPDPDLEVLAAAGEMAGVAAPIPASRQALITALLVAAARRATGSQESASAASQGGDGAPAGTRQPAENDGRPGAP